MREATTGSSRWTARAGVGLLAVLALLAGACGDDDGDDTGASGTGAPTETTGPGGTSGEGLPDEAQPLDERVSLTVGYLPSLSVAVLGAAQGLGYFDEENLDVSLSVIQSSQDANVLLAQGEFDVITGSMSAGFFNSIDRGLAVKAVGTPSTIGAVSGADTPAPSGVFVRKELADSGEITDYADMAGRRVASVGGVGASASYLVGLYAEAGGLTLKDVELVNLGIADSLTGLQQGSVDLAFLTSPFSQQALDSGAAVELGSARDIYGDETQSAFIMGPNLLEDNRQAAVAFMRALLRAAADMQGDYRSNDALVQAVSETYEIPVESIQNAPPYAVPADLAQQPETATRMQEMFLEYGGLLDYDEPMPIDRVIDDEIRQLAEQSLAGS